MIPIFSERALDAIKIVSVSTGAIGLTAGFLKWLTSIFQRVAETNRTTTLLATNHLPHIQMTLNEHSEKLVQVASDIRNMDTKISGYSQRLDDTKTAVDSLNGSFLNHLNTLQESIVVTVERKQQPLDSAERQA
jgi:signal transduction histidine kinase